MKCLQGASAIQEVLDEFKSAPVRVLVVWEPVLVTDYGPPSDSALARIGDNRAAQFWDRSKLTSEKALPVLRTDPAPVVGSKDLVTGRVVWDFAAIYPRGVRWEGSFPVPVFKGAPVVDVITEFKRRLSETLAAVPIQIGHRDADSKSSLAR